jgi:Uma2 family endonuclease
MPQNFASNILQMTSSVAQFPPLQAGDHLDQKTFHERYLAMPENFSAELVEGVVIVEAASSMGHADHHAAFMAWLGLYWAKTPGTHAMDNATVILGPNTEVQPDGSLIIETEYGGQTRPEGIYLSGPPEFIVEVVSSSAAYDLHSKLREYERAGVCEYVVLLLPEQRVEWFCLNGDKFDKHERSQDGTYRSRTFPGLWLNESAVVRCDVAGVIETLQQGIAEPEHAEFLEHLKKRRRR